MEIEEEEVKWEAMEPEKDEPVLTLGLRRRRAPERPLPQISFSQLTRLRQLDLKQFPELRPLWLGLSSIKHMLIRLTMLDLRTLKQLSELRPSRLKHFPEPVDLFPIKRLLPPLRAFASLRPWMQLSDIDLSNLDILPEIVGSFFYQAHDKILDSIAAFFSDLFHLKTVTLSDDDVRRLCLPPLLRAFASPRHWWQLSDIDLSNLEILPEIVGSFFYQEHDKILDSIAAFFSDLFHLKSVTLSDDDVRRLQPVLASRNNQPIPEFLMEKLPELASRNNQTIPEFLTEKLPELRSWNDYSLQELIGNTILMEKLPYLASRNTQRPLPELQANDNRLENLAASVFSQDDSNIDLLSMNENDVNQHVVYTVEAEQLLDAGESSRPREISGWTLLMTNLILEIASAVFDQMGYAQIGMVLAFVALLLAAVELIHMARMERIKRAAGMSPLPLFHLRSTYTSATRKPVGTIVEYFGLAGAVWQCVYSTVEYTYTRQEKDNPIKMSLLPFIFLLCVVISKLLVDKSSIDKRSIDKSS